MKKILLIALIAVVAIPIVAFKITVWRECRAANGWIYCVNIIAR